MSRYRAIFESLVDGAGGGGNERARDDTPVHSTSCYGNGDFSSALIAISDE